MRSIGSGLGFWRRPLAEHSYYYFNFTSHKYNRITVYNFVYRVYSDLSNLIIN